MFKGITVCLAIMGMVGLNEVSADLVGSAPVNTVQGTSNINLNLTTAGTRQQLGIFLVSSNDSLGFRVTFTFQNKGLFKAGSRQVTLSNLVLNKLGGTLGVGLTEPVDVPITLDGAGSWIWSPGPVLPSTETDAYLVEIAGDWPDPSGGIAGFYYEKVTCTISSGL